MRLITPHFTFEEATITSKDIPNVPTPTEAITITRTAAHMELVRSVLGNVGLHVSSWFRSDAVNRAVGGAHNSQHLEGEAVDFTCPAFKGGDIREICVALVNSYSLLQFDQLICEHHNGSEWVHISFAVSPTRNPRGQVLSLIKSGAYVGGICNPDGTKYVAKTLRS